MSVDAVIASVLKKASKVQDTLKPASGDKKPTLAKAKTNQSHSIVNSVSSPIVPVVGVSTPGEDIKKFLAKKVSKTNSTSLLDDKKK